MIEKLFTASKVSVAIYRLAVSSIGLIAIGYKIMTGRQPKHPNARKDRVD